MVPHDVPAEGRVWWVEDCDVAAAIDSWGGGGLSLGRWAGTLRQVDEPAWFDRDDLAPFRAMCFDRVSAIRRRLHTNGR